ncbi:flagellar protein FlaG [Brevibacillus porteri]|uniref:flagellar protein FlaG n=2 Tax=Brevibacillus TaxID=55080 RepID=UPI001EE14581|nr:flagellar protein FlaG [Brevibacillus sp. HB1.4B]
MDQWINGGGKMDINSKGVAVNGVSGYSDKVLKVNGSNQGKEDIDGQQQPSGKTLNSKELVREVDNLNKFMQSSTTHIKFTLHEKLNEYYVQVVNDQTKEVIREIPSKKVMDMVAKMHEMIGLLVDEKR